MNPEPYFHPRFEGQRSRARVQDLGTFGLAPCAQGNLYMRTAPDASADSTNPGPLPFPAGERRALSFQKRVFQLLSSSLA